MAEALVIARVAAVQGEVFARSPEGKVRRLKVGDPVREGDVVTPGEGGRVELALADGTTRLVRSGEQLTVDAEVAAEVKPDARDAALAGVTDTDKVIKAIKEGASLDELLEETAAGEAGGADGGSSFVRLVRISEAVSPLNFQFGSTDRANSDELPRSDGGVGGASQGGAGGTGTGSISPTATASTSSGNEDTDIAVGLSGTDPDGTVVSVTVTSLPAAAQGVLYLADGVTAVVAGTAITAAQAATLVFKPTLNFNGTVTIPFTVTDNEGNVSAPANEVVTVSSVADLPTTNDQSVSGTEDGGAIAITLSGGDVDGTVASFTIGSLPANGTLLYAGNPVTVGQVISATGNAASLSFTPNANWNGNTSFTYAATDNEGNVDASPATISIGVTAGIDLPTTNDQSVSGTEDGGAIAITLSGGDVDGTVASFTIGSLPANGTLLYAGNPVTVGQVISATGNAASLSFTPNANWNGNTSFTYAATDNEGNVDASPATISIGVTAGIDLPTTNDQSVSGTEDGGAIAITLSGGDVDGTVASFTIGSLPANGTLLYAGNPVTVGQVISATGNAASLSFTPNANWNGNTSFTYAATDNEGNVDASPATISIGVTAGIDLPTTNDQSVSGTEDGGAIAITLSGGDVDGTVASFTIGSLPANGTLLYAGNPVTVGQVISATGNAASLSFTPNANWNGNTSFTYAATDNEGNVDASPATISIGVTAGIDLPTTNDQSVSGTEDGGAIAITLSGGDVDGTVASFTIGSLPANGTLLYAGNPVTVGPSRMPRRTTKATWMPARRRYRLASRRGLTCPRRTTRA
ncbi:MAG: retention module-containing protein [Betaproteobacteria bacterium]|uniref:Retention module-containing protein n=1 Tax=Candidatus Proximibacter danicus TaxID=2954365 RepID=A0A9D7K2B2_9PROT|nr:retention module-containing protein [Candidatus Proximibacter danicus]